jgi:hypothetical protein
MVAAGSREQAIPRWKQVGSTRPDRRDDSERIGITVSPQALSNRFRVLVIVSRIRNHTNNEDIMESSFVKAGIGFAILMIVGFVIVGTTRETQQEKVQGAFIQTSSMLNSLALEKCSTAVKNETNAHPYTPSESSSDNLTYVQLEWKDVGSAKHAQCRYVMDQGITLLKIDDRTVIEKEAPATAAPATGAPKHH